MSGRYQIRHEISVSKVPFEVAKYIDIFYQQRHFMHYTLQKVNIELKE